MSKSAPDLEQALALTSRGRARRPVETHEDRPPRVMIAIHVDPDPGRPHKRVAHASFRCRIRSRDGSDPARRRPLRGKCLPRSVG